MNGYNDSADPRGAEERRRENDVRKRLAREIEIADIRWLLSSKKGRRFMWRLLEISGTFRLSFSTNAMQMAFAEGNRNLGNQLLSEVMTICPELYPVMLKEQQNDRDGDGPKSN